MASVVLIVSIVIKAVTFLMVLYTFLSINRPEKSDKNVSVVTKYYIMKRRYEMLKASLLFVAAIAVLELISMTHILISGNLYVGDTEMLISDIIFLGLVLLLTRIYNFRDHITQALRDAMKDNKLKH